MHALRDLKFKIQNSKFITYVWWLATAALVIALALRFTMRALGVRDDIPFPGVVYSVTAPLVEPFYRFFPPGNARLDYPALEVASLVAAGVVIALGLGVYVVGLLLTAGRDQKAQPK
jgi:uncharacterized protein YggT (Ycf19 family)